MTAYGPPPAPRPDASHDQRARMLALVAGGLGILLFIWGFLNWFSENTGAKTTYGGYVFISNTTGAIGFGIAAGLVALGHAYERRPLAMLPLALSVTSLLLLIGLLIGKGHADSGTGSPDVGVSAGYVLALITVILQVAALVVEWLASAGRLPARSPGTAAPAAWSGGTYPPPNQYGPPTSYGSPQGEYRGPQQPYAPPAYPSGAPGSAPAGPVTGGPAGEPTRAMPAPGMPAPGMPAPGMPGMPGTPGAAPGAAPGVEPQAGPGQPGGHPGQYPPPPAGEYQPQHPQ